METKKRKTLEEAELNVVLFDNDNVVATSEGCSTDGCTCDSQDNSCFVAGTKVTMADGSVKNIEDVHVGDVIVAYDVLNSQFYDTVITNTSIHSCNTISTVTLASGSIVKCTPSHPIYTSEGWKSVDPSFVSGVNEYKSYELHIGDCILTANGYSKVVSIDTEVGENIPVYHLSVQSNGDTENCTYVANSFVVHNISCLASGTKVTMADGSVKNIEDICEGDVVLTFDHEAGCFVGNAVLYAYQGEVPKCAFTLRFSNGTTLSIVGEHDLFEQESRKYVILTEENAEQFIGKHFYSADEHGYVVLVSVTHETEAADYYEIYTAKTLNMVANGMLNVADDVDYLLNLYEFDENLKADDKVLAEDIATYGLFDIPKDSGFSKQESADWRQSYLNIAVGKGLTSWDDLWNQHSEYLNAKDNKGISKCA